MAEVITLSVIRAERYNPGNGAHEVLLSIIKNKRATDGVLADLWLGGFKVVSLEPKDKEPQGG